MTVPLLLWLLRIVLGVGTLVIGCVLAGVLYVLLPWLDTERP